MVKRRDMLKDTKKNLGCLRRSQEIFGQKIRTILNRRTRGVKPHQSWDPWLSLAEKTHQSEKAEVCVDRKTVKGEGTSIQQRSLHVA